MEDSQGAPLRVDGPDIDQDTQEHRYTVHGEERDVQFRVIPEEREGEKGWGLRIEGIPGPGIVRERPWQAVEAARDAAVRAIADVLALERMQRDEKGRQRIPEPNAESESGGPKS
jgi:hypothetical protein